MDSAGDYIEYTMCVDIQEYQWCCYLVFCYYNKIKHKTSEVALVV